MSAADHLQVGQFGRLDFSQIRMHQTSMSEAAHDTMSGRPSRTEGPLEVSPTDHGDFQLTDGYHRAFDRMLAGHPSTLVHVKEDPPYLIASDKERVNSLDDIADRDVQHDWHRQRVRRLP
jgi:hypothetical protein